MKIFITGANGQLGKTFSEIYPKKNLYLGTKEKLDVTRKSQVLTQIKKNKPEIILHFASMTRGDECARNPQKAYEINVNGTKNIVEAAKKNNSVLLFISTNEVFDGKKKTPYTERDKPNPMTVIGMTKYNAEKIIQEKLSEYFIIRTSWLYSKWSQNFLQTVIARARKNKKIKLVTDEISSPTYSLDLSLAIKKIILTKKYGVYHLVNTGKASRLEFAQKAFELSGINGTEIIPIKLRNFNRRSKPPLYTPLDNKKAGQLGISFPRWENALEGFISSVSI